MVSLRIATVSHWVGLLSVLLVAACESDESNNQGRRDAAADAAAKPVDAGDAGAKDSALLVAVFVRTPDDRNVYVGAVPEVPNGKLDYSQFIEFGSIDAYTANGFVYVWDREPAQMTQYTVTKDMQLKKGPTVDMLEYGLGGGGVPSFASEHLAYVLSQQLDVIVKFDPTTMEILATIEVEPLKREGMDTYAVDVYRYGDKTAWLLYSENYEDFEIHHSVSLLILSAGEDEAKLITDDRCAGADGGHVDENGDLYIRSNATWGLYAAYGDKHESVKTCTLRVKKGETEFDPSYLLDHKELTGSYVNGPWFHLDGTRYIANVWADDVPFPEDPDEFWNGVGYRQFLVDIEAKTAEPYEHLKDSVLVSSIEFRVDGVPYYQLSKTGSVLGGETEIVELRPDGVKKTFELPELWSFARIR